KVTAHGSARTNTATPRHQSPHCSLPLHTLPIRKLYLFDYNSHSVGQTDGTGEGNAGSESTSSPHLAFVVE
ncbi:hypothetical protein J6590_105423, partial [Homalodisca vitripennis]